MYQPAGTRQQVLWRQSNVQVAGIAVAGNCIMCILFFGFGLLLMGTISMAASTAYYSKPFDSEFFRNQPNIPRTIGTIFLSIGGVIFGVGLILLVIIIRKAKRESRNYQVPMSNADVIISGTPYPGTNYASTQPYPTTGQAQPYPTQPNAQFQPYNSNAGQGLQYPPVPGQGQPYAPVPGQDYPPASGPEQPYPAVAGQGQSYPTISGTGQPYPPVSGQGQPYPPGPGQLHPSTGVQPYSPASGIPEKSADTTNLPYNPAFAHQTPPSGYPGSGQPPPPDAPPPYSEMRH